MRKEPIVALALLSLSSFPAPTQAAEIDRLRWLAGCWASVGGEAGSGEQWTMPAANTMFGVSRTIRDGRLRAFEFSRIAAGDDGRLAFHAQPDGAPPTRFPMKSLDAASVIFEALEHDFPQRVIYRLTPDGRVAARIEGMIDGRPEAIDFPLQRTRCEPDQ